MSRCDPVPWTASWSRCVLWEPRPSDGAVIATSPWLSGHSVRGIEYTMPMASAQVKSCLLLAGALAERITKIEEPTPSRDHTERLLAAQGAEVSVDGTRITVRGGAQLRSRASPPQQSPQEERRRGLARDRPAAVQVVVLLLRGAKHRHADAGGVTQSRRGNPPPARAPKRGVRRRSRIRARSSRALPG